MTTEEKALAMVNAVALEECEEVNLAPRKTLCAALRLSVIEHEATKQEFDDFKQKVSDAAEEATDIIDNWSGDRDGAKCLQDFIIPKPKRDPMAEVWRELFANEYNLYEFIAAMDARGLEIREKNDG